MNDLLYTKDLTRVFKSNNNKVYALNKVSMTINRGEFTVLSGRSGSGKTTLINLLGALDLPTEGSVFLEGKDITKASEKERELLRRQKIGFIFQSVALMSLMTAYENVELALRIAGIKLNEIVNHYEEQLAGQSQSVETNKQLMTSLSHDVRTPLTTLIGYLDASHKGIVTGKEREDYIETARKKAHELKDYIDVLFEWFKLGSGEETFAVKPYEIAELSRNLLKDWIPIFEEKGLNYEITIPQQRIMAMVDFNGYSRILNNLVQNVLTHSGAGHIEISVSCHLKQAEICVADDGTGISKEDLAHIFERLYKCDKARSERGSGLGLNIAKELTAQMGGTITASSEPTKCTAFTLHFPLTD